MESFSGERAGHRRASLAVVLIGFVVAGLTLTGVLGQLQHRLHAVAGQPPSPTAWWIALALALTTGILSGPLFEGRSRRRAVALLGAVLVVLAGLAAIVHAGAGMSVEVLPAALVATGLCGVGLVRRAERPLSPRRDLATGPGEAVLRRLVRHSDDAVLVLDGSGRVTTCNGAAVQMFRCPAAEIVGAPLEALVDRGTTGLAPEAPESAADGIGRRRDGTRFPLEIVDGELGAGKKHLRVALLRDLSERHDQEDAFRHQALHDAVTGLGNGFLLRERMDCELRAARETLRPVAVLVLELEPRGEVDDTGDRRAPDPLLRMVANRLQAPLGPRDTIARLGEETFAVLLPEGDRERALRLARVLVDALGRPFDVEGAPRSVGARAGVALYPDHAREARRLLQRAHAALEAARGHGPDVAIGDARANRRGAALPSLAAELDQAVELSQFILCYQPKLSCLDDRPVGMEALVRWQHPRHGLLSPGAFIDLAERTGLIRPLTHWVLSAAADQIVAWRRDGLDLSVAVNLSARCLREPDLPGHVAEILRQRAVLPEHLLLEIPESAIVDDPGALELIIALDELGVGVAIDDFGTAASSLACLERLPVREIKIDPSFIRDLDRGPEDVALVRATVALGHGLGLGVAAEGVEREAVWDRLKELGCDTGQGYLFSEPLPAGRVRAWCEQTLEHGRPRRDGDGRLTLAPPPQRP